MNGWILSITFWSLRSRILMSQELWKGSSLSDFSSIAQVTHDYSFKVHQKRIICHTQPFSASWADAKEFDIVFHQSQHFHQSLLWIMFTGNPKTGLHMCLVEDGDLLDFRPLQHSVSPMVSLVTEVPAVSRSLISSFRAVLGCFGTFSWSSSPHESRCCMDFGPFYISSISE